MNPGRFFRTWEIAGKTVKVNQLEWGFVTSNRKMAIAKTIAG